MSNCTCNGHAALSSNAKANFYDKNFIPQKWRLSYFGPLTKGAILYLDGYCKDCYGDLEEQVSVLKFTTREEMFEAVYNTIQTAHPYSKVLEPQYAQAADGKPQYYGGLDARNSFYQSRDGKSQHRRNTDFLRLFSDYDREAARLWLEERYPLQVHEQVLRDTGGSLFCTALRMAKENGDFDKAAPILDYVLPSEHESGTRETVELTAYEFDFLATANFGGSEGIYLDCYLRGKFDGSDRFTLNVGTIKTLRRDLDALKIMAELGGALTYHANRYVNEQIHRYTPKAELEAEARRKREKEEKECASHGTETA